IGGPKDRPSGSLAALDRSPEEMMESLGLGRQEPLASTSRHERKGSPRRGSPVDLLLDIDSFPAASPSYEARIPQRGKTATISTDPGPSAPSPMTSANLSM